MLRRRLGMVQRLSQAAPTDCAISMVTVYELFCGVEKAQEPAKEREKVQRFISAIIVNGKATFTDSDANAHPKRFYRPKP